MSNNVESKPNQKKKRGRPVTNKIYWTTETDDYVFEYIKEFDDLRRDWIFKEHLYKPLIKLSDAMIWKLQCCKPMTAELDLESLRATCLDKFFKISLPGSTHFKREKGRPFNYLTSTIRNHLLGYINDIHKRKKKIETNYYDNEEFIFQDKVNFLGEDTYTEIELEEDHVDSKKVYENLIKLIEIDLKNDNFKSKKETEFAKHLLYFMKNVTKDSSSDFNWHNKFFVKMVLQEITGLPRYKINYNLSKIGKRYLGKAYEA